MKRRKTVAYCVTIPDWLPSSVNALLGKHPASRSHVKRADALVVAAMLRYHDVPQARGKRRVSIAMYQPSGKLGDPDNRLKSCLDALVKCSMLRDDSADWCELGRITLERGPRETTIELEDLYP